jgi:release factor glutamine methyltransferase
MQVQNFLTKATQRLDQAGIATSRLDVLVLIEDRLGIDRAQLLARPELALSLSDKNVLNDQIVRRSHHVPLAYIRGKTEFYGRDFIITPAVLEPRPESETMIELFKQVLETGPEFKKSGHVEPVSTPSASLQVRAASKKASADPKTAQKQPIRVADVGSGSGAIGTTAKLEKPEISIDLLEIDDEAIKISKLNVDKYTTHIPVIKSDLLTASPQDYAILLCNLPYVPDDFQINTAATHEPRLAIFGGPDGLDIYCRLFDQLKIVAIKPLYVIIENLPFQHLESSRIAASAGYQLLQTEDLIQVFHKAKN